MASTARPLPRRPTQIRGGKSLHIPVEPGRVLGELVGGGSFPGWGQQSPLSVPAPRGQVCEVAGESWGLHVVARGNMRWPLGTAHALHTQGRRPRGGVERLLLCSGSLAGDGDTCCSSRIIAPPVLSVGVKSRVRTTAPVGRAQPCVRPQASTFHWHTERKWPSSLENKIPLDPCVKQMHPEPHVSATCLHPHPSAPSKACGLRPEAQANPTHPCIGSCLPFGPGRLSEVESSKPVFIPFDS